MSIRDIEFLFVPRGYTVITSDYPLVCCLERQEDLIIDFLESYPEFACKTIQKAHHLAQYYEVICCIILYKKEGHILHELEFDDDVLKKFKKINIIKYLDLKKNILDIGIILPTPKTF